MRTNWAGNHVFRAPRHLAVQSVAEVQSIVASARKLRVLGSGHSFNALADSEEVQISLSGLDHALRIDEGRRQVTFNGGLRYGDLAPALHDQGWALANLASLPHITVAGAVMTATHGSGSGIGNLATQVVALDLVTASGDILSLSRETHGGLFSGAVVSLGMLGVVVGLTLKIEPTYQLHQTVYTGLPFTVLEAEFDALFDSATSVSVFTDWRGDAAQAVWLKDRVSGPQAPTAPGADLFGAAPATRKMHPLPDGNGEDCTDQLGQPGPWHERLPHFRMGFAPSHGAEIQAEYFVPRDCAAAAVRVMRRHGNRLAHLLMVSELRTVAADDLWLSPGSRGPYVGVHFTFRRDPAGVLAVLPAIEADLAAFGAVPHWGKVSTMAPSSIRSGFPRLPEFRDLAQTFDPQGKFRNGHLDHLFAGP